MKVPIQIARVKFMPMKELPRGMIGKAVYSHPLNMRDGDIIRQGRHFAIVWRPIREIFRDVFWGQ